MSTAGAVLDDDQRVEPAEQHRVHVDEVDGEDAAGLGCQELPPGRASPAGCRTDPGIMQDLPHRGRRDRVAGLDELALHAPVPPGGIVRGDADHKLADRGCRKWPSGTPPARIIPFACDQPPVPGEQRRRGHVEHLSPALPGNQPGQRCEPQPVARLVPDPGGVTAQHRVLMSQHQ